MLTRRLQRVPLCLGQKMRAVSLFRQIRPMTVLNGARQQKCETKRVGEVFRPLVWLARHIRVQLVRCITSAKFATDCTPFQAKPFFLSRFAGFICGKHKMNTTLEGPKVLTHIDGLRLVSVCKRRTSELGGPAGEQIVSNEAK